MNENTGAFALGLIVAALLYLVLHKELHPRRNGAATPESPGSGGNNAPSNCGTCGTGKTGQVIPIGGQSYQTESSSYGGSSVFAATVEKWFGYQ
jgi:hypothetical protein